MTMRTINNIIIHCAATPNGQHFNANDCDQWHKERGFLRDPEASKGSSLKSIGYHYWINTNGYIEEGRTHDEIPAANRGYPNRDSRALSRLAEKGDP